MTSADYLSTGFGRPPRCLRHPSAGRLTVQSTQERLLTASELHHPLRDPHMVPINLTVAEFLAGWHRSAVVRTAHLRHRVRIAYRHFAERDGGGMSKRKPGRPRLSERLPERERLVVLRRIAELEAERKALRELL